MKIANAERQRSINGALSISVPRTILAGAHLTLRRFASQGGES